MRRRDWLICAAALAIAFAVTIGVYRNVKAEAAVNDARIEEALRRCR